jgi:hypothetical protein
VQSHIGENTVRTISMIQLTVWAEDMR